MLDLLALAFSTLSFASITHPRMSLRLASLYRTSSARLHVKLLPRLTCIYSFHQIILCPRRRYFKDPPSAPRRFFPPLPLASHLCLTLFPLFVFAPIASSVTRSFFFETPAQRAQRIE